LGDFKSTRFVVMLFWVGNMFISYICLYFYCA